ncbi:restriction endonuclease subunit S [Methylobacter sp.]|uniref:restriction endonuclease subunit S n=1 Tax=Methylobacter sp. TaxID=2051955 RepID=UPI001205C446|nr:restriction endonuclease subunit S [Methylobacter sp.]TAK63625.1 MAG: restriction endonuclease subunit S [Methylobacter sp.]
MSIIHQLLTDHIHIWTAADTEKKSGRGRSSGNAASVYGIKKLRELILELAVRGKLVPQNPNEEPASELLKRIQAEKAKLIAEGKIKSPRPPLLQRGELTSPPTAASTSAPPFEKEDDFAKPTTPPFVKGGLGGISEEEQPFELPQGWEWARLGNLYSFEYGDNLPADKRSSTGEYPVYGSNGVVGSHNVCFINSPCIVIGRKGSAGALNLSLEKGCCVTDVAYYCIPPKSLDLIFSFKLFHTLGLDSLGKGIKPGLNRNEAYELPIAIPPLAEQHRIVAKVDELMALCDQLETQHCNAAEAHEKLVSHLLGTLTQSPNTVSPLCKRGGGGDLDWQRIAAHFDILFTTEASIDALKQTLLQLAVMGKLVPQDPNDEPAIELMNRLRMDRTKWLVRTEGNDPECKTMQKKLAALCEGKAPFLLPNLWATVHLIDCCRLLVDCHNKTAPYSVSGIPIIRTSNIRERKFRLENLKYVSEDTYQFWSRRCPPEPGDIMFTREAPMGEAAIIPLGAKYCLGQRTMLIRPMHDFIFNEYLLIALTEPHLLERSSDAAIGSTVKHLRVGAVEELNIPLPPLAEQHRIVAKVDELMTICDQLKSRITEANQLQQKLADVLVEQALS